MYNFFLYIVFDFFFFFSFYFVALVEEAFRPTLGLRSMEKLHAMNLNIHLEATQNLAQQKASR